MKQSETFNFGDELGQIREGFRRVSKDVFGKTYRLEILTAVELIGPPIWARDLAGTIGLAENVVSTELSACERLGALQHFPSPHDRRKLYQPLDHPIWAFAAALAQGLASTTVIEAEMGIATGNPHRTAAPEDA
ncbi:MAG TPA: hypothetical protein VHZ54_14820 [Solirubrobacterales bacterium]|jgi:hypothetical protein|nr:hypothetical protein [Solirubrobacterales bacterium]